MILNINSKTLETCYYEGSCNNLQPELVDGILRILQMLEAVTCIQDIKHIPGAVYYPDKRGRHSLGINTQWQISFGFKDGHVCDIEIERS